MRREWCHSRPEDLGDAARPRLERLHALLRSGKLEVRVLPDEVFGLIHGKAGVVTLADGRRTSFLGSANESRAAFRLNYELVWQDDAADAVAWVQEEFDALWSSPFAVELAEFVVGDLDRLARRELVEDWDWLRNPLPPRSEGKDFATLRGSLGLSDEDAYAPGYAIDRLRPPDKRRIDDAFKHLKKRHNPYVRTIVLRTREHLENTIDPETGEPCLTPIRVRLHGESDADAIRLPPFLEDAYHWAEEFCRRLAERANAGFFRTMLLRRMGSTMEAGRRTVEKILEEWEDLDAPECDEDPAKELRALTGEERATLSRLARAMEANRTRDPKCAAVLRLLVEDGWLGYGCIVFSQYFDSVWWLATQLTGEIPAEPIGVYAGANRSGVMRGGAFARRSREALKEAVREGGLRLLLGTDAASEGLNLQRLGALINLDLPWNPSRLEQRKGRIQRIGQVRPEIDIYNMRYADSVEDRVHRLLSERLESISRLFGQLPDTLEDVWVRVALGQVEEAKKTIDAVPDRHPFALRYHEVGRTDWESCARVLAGDARRRSLARGWAKR